MNPRTWTSSENRSFRTQLLRWYDRNKRKLPWRSDPTPYRVWISEIMLQQTQVSTVLPYYERFVRRFPDIRSLAVAREEEVLALWAGLGYYARGRNLLRTARKIVEAFGGEFPESPKDILALPGIGRYTAGAIQSIAFNQPQPVVDGNVKRVMARLHGVASDLPEEFFWSQAGTWVSARRPADFNQALMELGAVICLPRTPKCGECPVRLSCAALQTGMQDRIPQPKRRRKTEEVTAVILLVSNSGRLLLQGRQPGSFVPGAWGLPMIMIDASSDPGAAARDLARGLCIKGGTAMRARGRVSHAITHRRIVAHVFEIDGNLLGEVHLPLRWADALEIGGLVTSSLFRKAYQSLKDSEIRCLS